MCTSNPQQVANGVVVQVNHLMYNRVLYFQLTRKSIY